MRHLGFETVVQSQGFMDLISLRGRLMREHDNKQNENTMETLLTIGDVAKLMKLSERHIQNMVRDNSFPQPVRIGRTVRFRPSDIRRILNGPSDGEPKNLAI